MSTTSHLFAAIQSFPTALAKPALAALFAWLGLIKIVPSLNPVALSTEEFARLIGGIDTSVLLPAIGVLQIVAAIALLIPRLRLVAVIAFLALLGAVVIAVIAAHRALFIDSNHSLSGTGLALAKTAVLTLCALALTAAPSTPPKA